MGDVVSVCIPWRPSPSRMAPFERVMQFWGYTGWPIITADSDTEVFSLSQARNNAVAQANTPVVIISDADTIPTIENVVTAVTDPAGIWWPFRHYRIIDPMYLHVPFDELHKVPYINAWDGDGAMGVGGCIVCTVEEYWRLGGQPPEFIGWGWEDTAFTCVVETLSTPRRVKGNIYAFEHNTHAEGYNGAKADSPGWDRDMARNEKLIAPYKNARGRPWLMRELIKSRTGRDPVDGPNLGDPALVGRYHP